MSEKSTLAHSPSKETHIKSQSRCRPQFTPSQFFVSGDICPHRTVHIPQQLAQTGFLRYEAQLNVENIEIIFSSLRCHLTKLHWLTCLSQQLIGCFSVTCTILAGVTARPISTRVSTQRGCRSTQVTMETSVRPTWTPAACTRPTLRLR